MRKALLLLALGCATVVGYANHASVALFADGGQPLGDNRNTTPFVHAEASSYLAFAHAEAQTVHARVIALASVDQVAINALFPPNYRIGEAKAIAAISDNLTVRHAFLPYGTPITVEIRVFGSSHFSNTNGPNAVGYGSAVLWVRCLGRETGYARSSHGTPVSHPPILLNVFVGASLSLSAQLESKANAECSGTETMYGQSITLSEAMVYVTPAKAAWCENGEGFIYPRWNPTGPR